MKQLLQVKDALRTLYHNESVQNGLWNFGRYAMETGKNCIYQICLMPSALFSVCSHPQTRRVTKDVLIIAITNVMPIVVINFTRDELQKHNEMETYNSMALMVFMYGAAAVFIGYFKAPKIVRSGVLTITSVRAIREMHAHKPMTLCQTAHCSLIRFLQGEIRDYIVYYSTEAFIWALSYTPYVGSLLYLVLGIPHRGRYILSSRLSSLCQRHQVVYLTEYSEIALALGLVHMMMAKTCAHYLERYSGIDSSYYHSALLQLLLPFALAIAKQISLPKPVLSSERHRIDPLLYLQSITGWFFDVFCKGLKVKLAKGELICFNPLDFHTSLHSIHRCRNLLNSPFLQVLGRYTLPSMFQSKEKFLGDAIIKPNWIALRSSSLQAIGSLFAIRKDLKVRFILLAPDAFFKLGLHLYFDIPAPLVGLILQGYRNSEVILKLLYLRSYLEGLDFDAKGNLKGFWGDFESFSWQEIAEKMEEDDFEDVQEEVKHCKEVLFQQAQAEQSAEWKLGSPMSAERSSQIMPKLIEDKFQAPPDPENKGLSHNQQRLSHDSNSFWSSHTKMSQAVNKALTVTNQLHSVLFTQHHQKKPKDLASDLESKPSDLSNRKRMKAVFFHDPVEVNTMIKKTAILNNHGT